MKHCNNYHLSDYCLVVTLLGAASFIQQLIVTVILWGQYFAFKETSSKSFRGNIQFGQGTVITYDWKSDLFDLKVITLYWVVSMKRWSSDRIMSIFFLLSKRDFKDHFSLNHIVDQQRGRFLVYKAVSLPAYLPSTLHDLPVTPGERSGCILYTLLQFLVCLISVSGFRA